MESLLLEYMMLFLPSQMLIEWIDLCLSQISTCGFHYSLNDSEGVWPRMICAFADHTQLWSQSPTQQAHLSATCIVTLVEAWALRAAGANSSADDAEEERKQVSGEGFGVNLKV